MKAMPTYHAVDSQCAPAVGDCPYEPTTTETIPLYTTVCAVTATGKPAPTESSDNHETKTLYTGQVHTITQCVHDAADCSIAAVTAEVASWTTTVVPVRKTQPAEEHKPVAEISKEVITSAHPNDEAYTKVVVPPATLKTATKPGVVGEQPSIFAAPTSSYTRKDTMKVSNPMSAIIRAPVTLVQAFVL
ncbi:hypothetical protein F66182_10061 [Fusarium sp. NRRL 66182]|nr:hypothetical protein F66182_10061 [Fusarium sp. NRRL 66182]